MLLGNRRDQNINMVFTTEDRILIENLHKCKGFGAKKLVKEFPGKGWNVRSLNRLLKKLHDSGTTVRPPESGRPRSARTDENIDTVNELVLSEEGVP